MAIIHNIPFHLCHGIGFDHNLQCRILFNPELVVSLKNCECTYSWYIWYNMSWVLRNYLKINELMVLIDYNKLFFQLFFSSSFYHYTITVIEGDFVDVGLLGPTIVNLLKRNAEMNKRLLTNSLHASCINHSKWEPHILILKDIRTQNKRNSFKLDIF